MMRKFNLIVMTMAISAMIIWPATAEEKKRVVILPFEILSVEDLGDMGRQIKTALAGALAQQGIMIVEPSEALLQSQEAFEAAEDARKSGREHEVDYVVWGSMTWLDGHYSLDAKMVQVAVQEPAELFFDKGRDAETVLATVQVLGDRIGQKIFNRSRVLHIVIEGNQRIEDDAIRRKIETRIGEPYSAKIVSEDIKRIFAMGFFEDIRVEFEAEPDGDVITFLITEKPTIRAIRFVGNDVYKSKKLNEELDLRAGAVVNRFSVERNVKRLKDLYKEKNYHNIQIDYTIEAVANNQADIEFIIVEGAKIMIRGITFSGNEHFSARKLKKVMRTSEKGFFSWITSSGDLNMEDLEQDALRIKTLYQNEGYIAARVSDPQVSFEEEGIFVAFKISEGARYKVGRVTISGDDLSGESGQTAPEGKPKRRKAPGKRAMTREEMLAVLKISEEPFYHLEVLRSDILRLKDIYADSGYALADISPDIERDTENQVVHIDLRVNKGELVFFEKIVIQGNHRTRDKVIRRELGVYEQEPYSGARLKRGVRNLHRLGYFDDVQVDTSRGSADNLMILTIDVEERATGNFQIGGGYSSSDGLYGTGGITESNFLGKGWVLNFSAQLGGSSSRFKLSFTEPWLFDIPLSVGPDLYYWTRDYTDYNRKSTGGGFRIGYPIFPDARLTFRYTYDITKLDNISEDASNQIQELDGEYATSSVAGILRYDTRNHAFTPDRGQTHRLTIEYAGLGGDIDFIKSVAELGVYVPLFKRLVLFLHSEGGYIDRLGGGLLPDYERFYLGGINSLRGFKYGDVAATDEEGLDIGGDQYVQGNVELIITLLKGANVNGVLFYDTGNVYGENENIDLGNLRQTAGYGIRWLSPIGPIRLERGHILDPKADESSSGRWEFTMGTTF